MAASARTVTPSHHGFASNGLAQQLPLPTTSANSLAAPIAAAVSQASRRSASPRSPRSTSPAVSAASKPVLPTSIGKMTPRAPSQPRDDKPAAAAAAQRPNAIERAVIAGKEAATKMSQPMVEVAKSITVPDHNSTSSAQPSPVSVASYTSTNAPTTTTAGSAAPAVAAPAPRAENTSGIAGPESGRAAVDPGLPQLQENTPNRSYTFPPPLNDNLHTPSQRNLSLPNNVYSSGSPKPGSGKRHRCPYCSTEFTRHHNLKSHLLTHSQEKPYECQQCHSKFRRLHDLKRHTKLHTGERPHSCINCGRKFARGDALARHSKGPGGCAGRRPSFIEEDPSGSRTADDTMDGIEYTDEPEHMDEDEGADRSATDPSKQRQRQDSYRPAAGTYPGVAPPGGLPGVFSSRDQHQPPPQRSRDPSISSSGPLASVQHYNAAQSAVFPQSSITESPKPLSPGQPGDRSLPGPPRASGQFSHTHRASSPINYPPPPSSGAPTLPSLPNFVPPPAPQPSSHAGSLSSHQSGSMGSTREMPAPTNNAGSGSSAGGDVWGYIRDLENKLNQSQRERDQLIAQLRADHARTDQDNRNQILGLRDEVERLKAQLKEKPRA